MPGVQGPGPGQETRQLVHSRHPRHQRAAAGQQASLQAVQDLGVAAPAGERQAGPGGALRPRRHVRGQEAVLHLAADREDGQGEEGGCWLVLQKVASELHP